MPGHNLRVDCQGGTLVPPFNSDADAALVSVQALPVQCHYSADTDVGFGIIETIGNSLLDTMCLTRDEWSYPQLLFLWGYPT